MRTITLFSLFLSLLFFSCQDDDNAGFACIDCYPKYVKYIYPDDPESNKRIDFFYTDCRLDKIEMDDGSGIEYKYLPDGKLSEMIPILIGSTTFAKDVFTYDSLGQLHQHLVYKSAIPDSLHRKVEYEYQNGKLYGSSHWQYHLAFYYYEERYVFDGDGNIIRVSKSDVQASIGGGYNFIYDDKNHWLKNVGVPIIRNAASSTTITDRHLPGTIHNNFTEQKHRSFDNGGNLTDESVEVSRTYEYNSGGYPTKIEVEDRNRKYRIEIAYGDCN